MQIRRVLSPGLGAGPVLSAAATLLGDFRHIFSSFKDFVSPQLFSLGMRLASVLFYRPEAASPPCQLQSSWLDLTPWWVSPSAPSTAQPFCWRCHKVWQHGNKKHATETNAILGGVSGGSHWWLLPCFVSHPHPLRAADLPQFPLWLSVLSGAC